MMMTTTYRHVLLAVLLGLLLVACTKKDNPLAERKQGEKPDQAQLSSAELPSAHPPLAADTQRRQQIQRTEQQLRQAVQQAPESAQALARLAGFLLSHNRTAEAIPLYQDAIVQDPENPKLFAALSIAYLHQSKAAMAKAMADHALKLDPGMEPVRKIQQYIAQKQAVVEQAQRASQAGVQTPEDALHRMVSPAAGSGGQ